MLRQQERRLGFLFASIIAATAAGVGFACSSSSSKDAPNNDGGDEGGGSSSGLGTADASYEADIQCALGAATVMAGTKETCRYFAYWPCELPPGVDYDGLMTECGPFCPDNTSVPYECYLWAGDGGVTVQTLDGGGPEGGLGEAGTAGLPTNIPPTGIVVWCDTCLMGGRRPPGLRRARRSRGSAVGRYFAGMARLEAASVTAFEVLATELAALGAPTRLTSAARRSARDEVRHARAMTRLAGRFGVRVRPPRVGPRRWGSLAKLARDNASEGCVRETFAALVATWQAQHATDPEIARVMKRVAADETRHAALSHEIDRWALSRLGPAERRRHERARANAISTLRAELQAGPPWQAAPGLGLPLPEEAVRLLDTLVVQLTA
jgi:hypothetical protein